MIEPPRNSNTNRERIVQILFETFKLPGLCVMNSASLSLFTSGHTRVVVCECGSGMSHAVPLLEGFAPLHAILCSEIAGQDVTSPIATSLKKTGT